MTQIGVCSWSLQPTGPDDLVQQVHACGLNHLQLALDPIRRGVWDEHRTKHLLNSANITLLSGMMAMEGEDYSSLESIARTGGVRSDLHWPNNLAAAHQNAAMARRMGIHLVTFHAGFLPQDSNDPLRPIMLDRLKQLADVFATEEIAVAFETGQENAATLRSVLMDLHSDAVGINFDPANLVLYGMGDPVESFSMLADRVKQVHIKDARATLTAGTWGSETRVGEGDVNWPEFLRLVAEKTPGVNLVIERESRAVDAVADIRAAHLLLQKHLNHMQKASS